MAGFLRQASDRHALRRAYWQPEPLPHATTVWSGWTLIATSGTAAAAKARNAARNCSTKTIFMALSPSPAGANVPPVSHAVCDLSHTNAHDQSDQRGQVSARSSTVQGGGKRRGDAIARPSVGRVAINDLARLVLHNNGRLRVLWPEVYSEVIEHPASNFDRSGVITDPATIRCSGRCVGWTCGRGSVAGREYRPPYSQA